MVGEGFTEGKYRNFPYPFLTIAEKYHDLLQLPEKALKESKHISSIFHLGVYRRQDQGNHLLSQLIRKYKRFGHPELAHPLAWLIADIILCRKTELVEDIDIIVPLPSNPNKQTERGFTPCLLIAEELSKCLAIPYFEMFMVAPTNYRFREMSFIEGKKLIKNKRGQPHTIASGKSVLIIDDVATSGRTLSLHAEMLIEANARKVHALTLAKTGPPLEKNRK